MNKEKKHVTWDESLDEIGVTEDEKRIMNLKTKLYREAVQARKDAQLTQKEVSKKTALHIPSISKIESGNTDLRVSTLIRYLSAMNKTITVIDIDD